VSPKRYARIARIRRVLARAGTASWAQIAAEQGFFDQAHLSGEFHALVGYSPRAFFQQGLQGAKRCGAG
jgi:transcriptional regulator GlxA family with amidase domain